MTEVVTGRRGGHGDPQPWTSRDTTVIGGLAALAAVAIGLGAVGMSRIQPVAGLALLDTAHISTLHSFCLPIWRTSGSTPRHLLGSYQAISPCLSPVV